MVVKDGIVLLGSPLGSKAFEKKTISDRIDKVQEISEKLSANTMDAQSEYVLLRCCLAIPKIMFMSA